MSTVKELLNKSIERLSQKNIENAKLAAQSIIAKVINVPRLEIYFLIDKKLTSNQVDEIENLIEKRLNHQPLEQILESVFFYNSEIQVTKDVLIPRVETEYLVDLIIKILEKEKTLENKIFIDMCSGSGCIGIAIKKRFPKLKVIISEVCEKAIKIAKINIKNNLVDISIRQGDFLNTLVDIKADFFVCNPPYISIDEYISLAKDVKDYEPKGALVAKDDGLEFYKRLAKSLNKYLNSRGKVFLEMGHLQSFIVKDLFKDGIWRNKNIILDQYNKERFFFLELE
jgi:release factor glutamine methyltransferase